jgi:hypothetical protein
MCVLVNETFKKMTLIISPFVHLGLWAPSQGGYCITIDTISQLSLGGIIVIYLDRLRR